jgi:hypothetical protein
VGVDSDLFTKETNQKLKKLDPSLHAGLFTSLFGKLLFNDEQNAKQMFHLKEIAKRHEEVL